MRTQTQVAKYRAIAGVNDSACSNCGCTKYLEVHHIDMNPNNDVRANLSVLCHVCHTKLHGTETKRFSKSQRGSSGKLAKGTRRRK